MENPKDPSDSILLNDVGIEQSQKLKFDERPESSKCVMPKTKKQTKRPISHGLNEETHTHCTGSVAAAVEGCMSPDPSFDINAIDTRGQGH